MKTIPIILLILLCACGQTYKQNKSADFGNDLFLHKTSVKYSKRFNIEYHNSFKVLSVFTGWKNSDTLFRYVLVQKGQPKPTGYENAQVVEIPLNKTICLSCVYVAYFDKLGLGDKLAAVDDFRYINSPVVNRLIEKGKIAQVSTGAALNMEQVLNIKPDMVFTYGMGNPQYDSHPKLIEAGIPVAVAVDNLENSPLARAEWLKFVAVFFNKEKTADSIFDGIAEQYQKLAVLASSSADKPTVFTEFKYGDAWYMPGGQSYMATLLHDAGAHFLWDEDKHTGSLHLAFEEVYAKAGNADYWLNVGAWKNKTDALQADTRYADFYAWKTGKIYNNNAKMNGKGGNDYWEGGLLNPDLLLADLISIFHPDKMPNHQLTYYKKLANN